MAFLLHSLVPQRRWICTNGNKAETRPSSRLQRKFASQAGFALLVILGLICGLLPASVHAQSSDSANELEAFVNSHALAGAVTLVADKTTVLDIDTAGWADIAAGKKMQPETLFWIASQTKPMTATALMMLVDQGRVDLDAPVEKYLPELGGAWLTVEKNQTHWKLQRPARPVSIRDVLSHLSGYPYQTANEQPTLDVLKLADRVRSYGLVPLNTEPGTAYQYSNVGINIAGRVIEVISGRPYETFMAEELFMPLEMTETTFWPTPEQVERLAKSYAPNAAKTELVEKPISQLQYPLTDRSGRFPLPAGGLFSTAKDVARFCQMILNDGTFNGRKYLSAESVHTMTSRQTPATVQQNYGLGWQIQPTGFGHGGAHATNMSINPQQGIVTIFMVQHAGFPLNGNQSLGVFQKTAAEKFAK